VTGLEPESGKTYETRALRRSQFSNFHLFNRLDSSPKNNDSNLTHESFDSSQIFESIILVKAKEKFFLVLKLITHHKEVTMKKIYNKK
jgi:hypothetical protein